MIIVNREKIITNKQINKIINFLGKEYRPNKIIVFESKLQYLRYNIFYFYKLRELNRISISVLREKISGDYIKFGEVIKIYTFSDRVKNNKILTQLNIIHTLIHELRHKYQYNRINEIPKIKFNKEFLGEISELNNEVSRIENEFPDEEDDAEKFAFRIIKYNSQKIKEIMNWKEEWFLE